VKPNEKDPKYLGPQDFEDMLKDVRPEDVPTARFVVDIWRTINDYAKEHGLPNPVWKKEQTDGEET
jgi:hypothetical protein